MRAEIAPHADGDTTNVYSNVYSDVHFPGRSSGPGESIVNRCLRDLQVTDPREDRACIEGDRDSLLRDCYAWILDYASFQRWRTQDEARLLWIKGDPGKGKMTMMIGLITELSQDEPSKAASSEGPEFSNRNIRCHFLPEHGPNFKQCSLRAPWADRYTRYAKTAAHAIFTGAVRGCSDAAVRGP